MGKRNRQARALLQGAFLGMLLFAGLYANIFFHELGHYEAAKRLGLNPQLHLFEKGGAGFGFAEQQFYVSYSSPDTALDRADFEVALAGPLVNAFIALLLFAAYLRAPKSRPMLKKILAMLIIPAALSVAANLVPSPGADGSTIWAYLK